MENWTTFWGWTLIIVLVIYSGVSIAVTIGGFSDIKMLLKSLSQSHDSKDSSTEETTN